MVGALQRPGSGDERTRLRHPQGETSNHLGVETRYPRGPDGILGLPVVIAHQVASKFFESDRVAIEERKVVAVVRDERVRKPKHDRRVGSWYSRQPLGVELTRIIGADRTDAHELDSAALEVPDRADR
jgi:hypothetical protein